MNIDSKQQWSNYWRQGHLTSLPAGFASNYDGEFLQFWNSQFALLNTGARILDICSGNGSIALLAQTFSDAHDLGFKIKAVDAADIDVAGLIEKNPKLTNQIRAIEFMANTLFEDLPEKSSCADMVISQYGIEYTEWEVSAKKIHSLLKPGSYFSLVCHTLDSKIMTQMEIQHRDFTRLANLGIFTSTFENDHTRSFQIMFLQRLDLWLDTIYATFKKDRTSDVLSNVGRELDQILRLSQKDFNSGFESFVGFQQAVTISYLTASDIATLGDRLKVNPDWIEIFTNTGLDLVHSGDVRYHTGEKAGKFYQLRKPQ